MRAGVLALVLVALAFPVGLALAVYLTAAPSWAAEPVPAAITQRAIAEPNSTKTERREPQQTTTDRSGSDRCLEPEHRLDPECISGSGSGSDDGDSSGSGSSGSGSDNSGPGSGSSGSGSSGSSGSGSSGSGGGDD